MPRNPNCTRCPLHQAANHVCVWGVGSPRSGIMFVAEAPGEAEDSTGIPFQGAAGRELDKMLAKVDLVRDDVYITNVNKCRPPGNRSPDKIEAAACFSYLAEEITKVQPRVIVALGGTALKALTGREAVGKERGTVIAPKPGVRLGDAQLIATYHPAAYLHRRDPKLLEMLEQDLRTAKRLAAGEDAADHQANPKLLPHVLNIFPPTRGPQALSNALAHLHAGMQRAGTDPTHRLLAVDCEWTGERQRGKQKVMMTWPWVSGGQLHSIAVSGIVQDEDGVQRVETVAFATRPTVIQAGKDNAWLEWLPTIENAVFSRFLTDKLCVFHNAQADLLWLDALTLPITLGGDTAALGHAMGDQQISLESMSVLRLGMKPWKGPLWPKRPQDADDLAWEEMLSYNGQDTYATLLLERELRDDLKTYPGHERHAIVKNYTKLVLPATEVFVEMAIEGVPLDRKALRAAIEKAQAELRTVAATLAEVIGCRPQQAITIANSPPQTVEYLQRQGIAVFGSRQDELLDLQEAHPAIPLIGRVRKLSKLLGTYLVPWELMCLENDDDALHTVYRTTSVRTGRTSAETRRGASAQLVKRGDELRPLMRAPQGWLVASLDVNNIEMRIGSWIANEHNMQQLFIDGADLHEVMATFIQALRKGVTMKTFWPNRAAYIAQLKEKVGKAQFTILRQSAKPVNFGFLYGMQAEHFVDLARNEYGVVFTPAEAEDVRDAYFTLYPGLVRWHRDAERVVEQGFVITPMGRIRRDIADFRKAVNTPVQSTASDIVTYAGIQIQQAIKQRELPPARLISFVHDSVGLMGRGKMVDGVPTGDIAEAAEGAKYIMEHLDLRPFNVELPVPIVVESKVGEWWQ